MSNESFVRELAAEHSIPLKEHLPAISAYLAEDDEEISGAERIVQLYEAVQANQTLSRDEVYRCFRDLGFVAVGFDARKF